MSEGQVFMQLLLAMIGGGFLSYFEMEEKGRWWTRTIGGVFCAPIVITVWTVAIMGVPG